MKLSLTSILLSASVLMLAVPAISKADYQCNFSCGSKPHQEPKTGIGRTQTEASAKAQAQTCTQYVGGAPQFFLGCTEIDSPFNNRDNNNDRRDNGRGDWGRGGHGGGHGGGNWGRPREEYKCTFSCGSKPHQEPKVGFGRTQREASHNAQKQTCTQYVGGQPQFFRGCERVR